MAKSFFGLFHSQSAVEEDPLSSVKAISAWVDTLPANDPLGAVGSITRLLEEQGTRQPAITPARVQALLALDRMAQTPAAQLQAQYRLPLLTDDVRQKLWFARSDLARWFAYAYEQVYEGLCQQGDREKFRSVQHGLFVRMFHYRGIQARQSLFRYEQWIPAKWKFLHAAYQEALELGAANLPFSPFDNDPAGEPRSTEQEYIHFLLMQRVNTGNLTVLQIDTAAIWLREWVSALRLDKAPPDGEGARYWAIDLGQAAGLLADAPAEPAGRLLYLDVEPLAERMAELRTTTNAQLAAGPGKPEQREMKDRLALLKRLEALWLPHAGMQPRREERQAMQLPVLVAAGWHDISVMLREARPWRPHDPYMYTYDDAADLVARGRAPKPEKEKAGLAANLHPSRQGWRIHDVSESGCRILSTTKQAAQIQLGALLALLRESDTFWRLAVVRRLKRRTSEHTELGLEIIAERTVLVMPEVIRLNEAGTPVEPEAGARNKRFDALYIPPQQRSDAAPVYSIVIPVAHYAPNEMLTLSVEGEPRVIRLAVAIEYDKDWVWTTFEPLRLRRGPAEPARAA